MRHDDDHDDASDEEIEDMADKMSLDELDLNADADDATPQRLNHHSHLPSVRMYSSRPPALDDHGGESDETDYEDWAAIGAAALRQSSLPRGGSSFSSARLKSPNLGVGGGSWLSSSRGHGHGHGHSVGKKVDRGERRRSSAGLSLSRRGSSGMGWQQKGGVKEQSYPHGYGSVPLHVGGSGVGVGSLVVASPPLGPVVEADDVGMMGMDERAAAEALCRMGGSVE
ncbi:hypothetical protein LTS18_000351 [Coniosporium uncinatum]|uniref:Uncharacterized protein n=1 Tax=Coniosporium uncinatum TaxID=93489 RepID=A0ACC3DFU3_9PEZI|nr:hypothetical protein LTS18_000351 [Coniosporium uncinatum]